MRITILMVCLLASSVSGEDNKMAVPVLTPEELPNYQFERELKENPVVIQELSVGQEFILDAQRREMKELITRRLGILNFKQDIGDLKTIQQLVDRGVIEQREVREWQAVGVVFGDILVNEFGLHWISYEDDLGLSKALRWENTDNYVFPMTMFSRRVQFKQKIDAAAMFEKIRQEVIAFKEYEHRNLRI